MMRRFGALVVLFAIIHGGASRALSAHGGESLVLHPGDGGAPTAATGAGNDVPVASLPTGVETKAELDHREDVVNDLAASPAAHEAATDEARGAVKSVRAAVDDRADLLRRNTADAMAEAKHAANMAAEAEKAARDGTLPTPVDVASSVGEQAANDELIAKRRVVQAAAAAHRSTDLAQRAAREASFARLRELRLQDAVDDTDRFIAKLRTSLDQQREQLRAATRRLEHASTPDERRSAADAVEELHHKMRKFMASMDEYAKREATLKGARDRTRRVVQAAYTRVAARLALSELESMVVASSEMLERKKAALDTKMMAVAVGDLDVSGRQLADDLFTETQRAADVVASHAATLAAGGVELELRGNTTTAQAFAEAMRGAVAPANTTAMSGSARADDAACRRAAETAARAVAGMLREAESAVTLRAAVSQRAVRLVEARLHDHERELARVEALLENHEHWAKNSPRSVDRKSNQRAADRIRSEELPPAQQNVAALTASTAAVRSQSAGLDAVSEALRDLSHKVATAELGHQLAIDQRTAFAKASGQLENTWPFTSLRSVEAAWRGILPKETKKHASSAAESVPAAGVGEAPKPAEGAGGVAGIAFGDPTDLQRSAAAARTAAARAGPGVDTAAAADPREGMFTGATGSPQQAWDDMMTDDAIIAQLERVGEEDIMKWSLDTVTVPTGTTGSTGATGVASLGSLEDELPSTAAGVLELVDSDGDGAVSRDEFEHAVEVVAPGARIPAGEMDPLFASLDRDHSGKLERGEIQRWIDEEAVLLREGWWLQRINGMSGCELVGDCATVSSLTPKTEVAEARLLRRLAEAALDVSRMTSTSVHDIEEAAEGMMAIAAATGAAAEVEEITPEPELEPEPEPLPREPTKLEILQQQSAEADEEEKKDAEAWDVAKRTVAASERTADTLTADAKVAAMNAELVEKTILARGETKKAAAQEGEASAKKGEAAEAMDAVVQLRADVEAAQQSGDAAALAKAKAALAEAEAELARVRAETEAADKAAKAAEEKAALAEEEAEVATDNVVSAGMETEDGLDASFGNALETQREEVSAAREARREASKADALRAEASVALVRAASAAVRAAEARATARRAAAAAQEAVQAVREAEKKAGESGKPGLSAPVELYTEAQRKGREAADLNEKAKALELAANTALDAARAASLKAAEAEGKSQAALKLVSVTSGDAATETEDAELAAEQQGKAASHDAENDASSLMESAQAVAEMLAKGAMLAGREGAEARAEAARQAELADKAAEVAGSLRDEAERLAAESLKAKQEAVRMRRAANASPADELAARAADEAEAKAKKLAAAASEAMHRSREATVAADALQHDAAKMDREATKTEKSAESASAQASSTANEVKSWSAAAEAGPKEREATAKFEQAVAAARQATTQAAVKKELAEAAEEAAEAAREAVEAAEARVEQLRANGAREELVKEAEREADAKRDTVSTKAAAAELAAKAARDAEAAVAVAESAVRKDEVELTEDRAEAEVARESAAEAVEKSAEAAAEEEERIAVEEPVRSESTVPVGLEEDANGEPVVPAPPAASRGEADRPEYVERPEIVAEDESGETSTEKLEAVEAAEKAATAAMVQLIEAQHKLARSEAFVASLEADIGVREAEVGRLEGAADEARSTGASLQEVAEHEDALDAARAGLQQVSRELIAAKQAHAKLAASVAALEANARALQQTADKHAQRSDDAIAEVVAATEADVQRRKQHELVVQAEREAKAKAEAAAATAAAAEDDDVAKAPAAKESDEEASLRKAVAEKMKVLEQLVQAARTSARAAGHAAGREGALSGVWAQAQDNVRTAEAIASNEAVMAVKGVKGEMEDFLTASRKLQALLAAAESAVGKSATRAKSDADQLLQAVDDAAAAGEGLTAEAMAAAMGGGVASKKLSLSASLASSTDDGKATGRSEALAETVPLMKEMTESVHGVTRLVHEVMEARRKTATADEPAPQPSEDLEAVTAPLREGVEAQEESVKREATDAKTVAKATEEKAEADASEDERASQEALKEEAQAQEKADASKAAREEAEARDEAEKATKESEAKLAAALEANDDEEEELSLEADTKPPAHLPVPKPTVALWPEEALNAALRRSGAAAARMAEAVTTFATAVAEHRVEAETAAVKAGEASGKRSGAAWAVKELQSTLDAAKTCVSEDKCAHSREFASRMERATAAVADGSELGKEATAATKAMDSATDALAVATRNVVQSVRKVAAEIRFAREVLALSLSERKDAWADMEEARAKAHTIKRQLDDAVASADAYPTGPMRAYRELVRAVRAREASERDTARMATLEKWEAIVTEVGKEVKGVSRDAEFTHNSTVLAGSTAEESISADEKAAGHADAAVRDAAKGTRGLESTVETAKLTGERAITSMKMEGARGKVESAVAKTEEMTAKSQDARRAVARVAQAEVALQEANRKAARAKAEAEIAEGVAEAARESETAAKALAEQIASSAGAESAGAAMARDRADRKTEARKTAEAGVKEARRAATTAEVAVTQQETALTTLRGEAREAAAVATAAVDSAAVEADAAMLAVAAFQAAAAKLNPMPHVSEAEAQVTKVSAAARASAKAVKAALDAVDSVPAGGKNDVAVAETVNVALAKASELTEDALEAAQETARVVNAAVARVQSAAVEEESAGSESAAFQAAALAAEDAKLGVAALVQSLTDLIGAASSTSIALTKGAHVAEARRARMHVTQVEDTVASAASAMSTLAETVERAVSASPRAVVLAQAKKAAETVEAARQGFLGALSEIGSTEQKTSRAIQLRAEAEVAAVKAAAAKGLAARLYAEFAEAEEAVERLLALGVSPAALSDVELEVAQKRKAAAAAQAAAARATAQATNARTAERAEAEAAQARHAVLQVLDEALDAETEATGDELSASQALRALRLGGAASVAEGAMKARRRSVHAQEAAAEKRAAAVVAREAAIREAGAAEELRHLAEQAHTAARLATQEATQLRVAGASAPTVEKAVADAQRAHAEAAEIERDASEADLRAAELRRNADALEEAAGAAELAAVAAKAAASEAMQSTVDGWLASKKEAATRAAEDVVRATEMLDSAQRRAEEAEAKEAALGGETDGEGAVGAVEAEHARQDAATRSAEAAGDVEAAQKELDRAVAAKEESEKALEGAEMVVLEGVLKLAEEEARKARTVARRLVSAAERVRGSVSEATASVEEAQKRVAGAVKAVEAASEKLEALRKNATVPMEVVLEEEARVEALERAQTLAENEAVDLEGTLRAHRQLLEMAEARAREAQNEAADAGRFEDLIAAEVADMQVTAKRKAAGKDTAAQQAAEATAKSAGRVQSAAADADAKVRETEQALDEANLAVEAAQAKGRRAKLELDRVRAQLATAEKHMQEVIASGADDAAVKRASDRVSELVKAESKLSLEASQAEASAKRLAVEAEAARNDMIAAENEASRLGVEADAASAASSAQTTRADQEAGDGRLAEAEEDDAEWQTLAEAASEAENAALELHGAVAEAEAALEKEETLLGTTAKNATGDAKARLDRLIDALETKKAEAKAAEERAQSLREQANRAADVAKMAMTKAAGNKEEEERAAKALDATTNPLPKEPEDVPTSPGATPTPAVPTPPPRPPVSTGSMRGSGSSGTSSPAAPGKPGSGSVGGPRPGAGTPASGSGSGSGSGSAIGSGSGIGIDSGFGSGSGSASTLGPAPPSPINVGVPTKSAAVVAMEKANDALAHMEELEQTAREVRKLAEEAARVAEEKAAAVKKAEAAVVEAEGVLSDAATDEDSESARTALEEAKAAVRAAREAADAAAVAAKEQEDAANAAVREANKARDMAKGLAAEAARLGAKPGDLSMPSLPVDEESDSEAMRAAPKAREEAQKALTASLDARMAEESARATLREAAEVAVEKALAARSKRDAVLAAVEEYMSADASQRGKLRERVAELESKARVAEAEAKQAEGTWQEKRDTVESMAETTRELSLKAMEKAAAATEAARVSLEHQLSASARKAAETVIASERAYDVFVQKEQKALAAAGAVAALEARVESAERSVTKLEEALAEAEAAVADGNGSGALSGSGSGSASGSGSTAMVASSGAEMNQALLDRVESAAEALAAGRRALSSLEDALVEARVAARTARREADLAKSRYEGARGAAETARELALASARGMEEHRITSLGKAAERAEAVAEVRRRRAAALMETARASAAKAEALRARTQELTAKADAARQHESTLPADASESALEAATLQLETLRSASSAATSAASAAQDMANTADAAARAAVSEAKTAAKEARVARRESDVAAAQKGAAAVEAKEQEAGVEAQVAMKKSQGASLAATTVEVAKKALTLEQKKHADLDKRAAHAEAELAALRANKDTPRADIVFQTRFAQEARAAADEAADEMHVARLRVSSAEQQLADTERRAQEANSKSMDVLELALSMDAERTSHAAAVADMAVSDAEEALAEAEGKLTQAEASARDAADAEASAQAAAEMAVARLERLREEEASETEIVRAQDAANDAQAAATRAAERATEKEEAVREAEHAVAIARETHGASIRVSDNAVDDAALASERVRNQQLARAKQSATALRKRAISLERDVLRAQKVVAKEEERLAKLAETLAAAVSAAAAAGDLMSNAQEAARAEGAGAETRIAVADAQREVERSARRLDSARTAKSRSERHLEDARARVGKLVIERDAMVSAAKTARVEARALSLRTLSLSSLAAERSAARRAARAVRLVKMAGAAQTVARDAETVATQRENHAEDAQREANAALAMSARLEATGASAEKMRAQRERQWDATGVARAAVRAAAVAREEADVAMDDADAARETSLEAHREAAKAADVARGAHLALLRETAKQADEEAQVIDDDAVAAEREADARALAASRAEAQAVAMHENAEARRQAQSEAEAALVTAPKSGQQAAREKAVRARDIAESAAQERTNLADTLAREAEALRNAAMAARARAKKAEAAAREAANALHKAAVEGQDQVPPTLPALSALRASKQSAARLLESKVAEREAVRAGAAATKADEKATADEALAAMKHRAVESAKAALETARSRQSSIPGSSALSSEVVRAKAVVTSAEAEAASASKVARGSRAHAVALAAAADDARAEVRRLRSVARDAAETARDLSTEADELLASATTVEPAQGASLEDTVRTAGAMEEKIRAAMKEYQARLESVRSNVAELRAEANLRPGAGVGGFVQGMANATALEIEAAHHAWMGVQAMSEQMENAVGTLNRMVKEYSVSPAFRKATGWMMIHRIEVKAATGSNTKWTHIVFPRPFAQQPVVIATPSMEGSSGVTLRLRNVTALGFDIAPVLASPQGPHTGGMVVDYIAATPGQHAMLDGTVFEVGFDDVDAYQISPDCGSKLSKRASWHELRFGKTFSGTPSLLTQVQTMRNEGNNAPAGAAQPFVTVAVDHIHPGGARVALERGQSKSGTISKAERVGYLAMSQRASVMLDKDFHPVFYESFVSFPQVKGAARGNFYVGSRSFVGNAPAVFASTASRNNPRGGWVRRQSSAKWHHYMQLDNTVECGSRDLPEADRVSMLLFSDFGDFRVFEPLQADLVSESADIDSLTMRPAEKIKADLAAENAWEKHANMELSWVRFKHTGRDPRFTKLRFKQKYPTVPLVFFLNDRKDAEPADVRIKEVTQDYVIAAVMEPPKHFGTHATEEIPMLVVERGVHMLPDGTLIEANTLETNATQYDQDCVKHHEKKRWSRAKFEAPFASAPAVVTRIQSLRNERGNVPARASLPFLTSAVTKLDKVGVSLALERSRVKEGGEFVFQSETVAYIAFERSAGTFKDSAGRAIPYEFDVTAPMVRGQNAGCQFIGLRNMFPTRHQHRAPPMFLADKATHKSEEGGWMRNCGHHVWTQHWAIRIMIDKDTSCSPDRSHTYERASLAVFGDPFVLTRRNPNVAPPPPKPETSPVPATAPPRMEAGYALLTDTWKNPERTKIWFDKPFKQPPLVFLLPTQQDRRPVTIRIEKVSFEYFIATLVTPPGTHAAHHGQGAPYIAIEKGTHRLPNNVVIEAGTVATTAHQFSKSCVNQTVTSSVPDRWDRVSFAYNGFASTPAVLTQIQGMANEQLNPPKSVSMPFLTTTSRDASVDGFDVALERVHMVNMGVVRHPETVGYLAMETGAGSFSDDLGATILYEALTSRDAVHALDTQPRYARCWSVPFKRQYTALPPVVVASLASREHDKGGWVRLCGAGAQRHGIYMTIDTDFMCNEHGVRRRWHGAEDVSAFVWSKPFTRTLYGLDEDPLADAARIAAAKRRAALAENAAEAADELAALAQEEEEKEDAAQLAAMNKRLVAAAELKEEVASIARAASAKKSDALMAAEGEALQDQRAVEAAEKAGASAARLNALRSQAATAAARVDEAREAANAAFANATSLVMEAKEARAMADAGAMALRNAEESGDAAEEDEFGFEKVRPKGPGVIDAASVLATVRTRMEQELAAGLTELKEAELLMGYMDSRLHEGNASAKLGSQEAAILDAARSIRDDSAVAGDSAAALETTLQTMRETLAQMRSRAREYRAMPHFRTITGKMWMERIEVVSTHGTKEWTHIRFPTPFAFQPVVIVTPSMEGAGSATLRIKDVTTDGFDVIAVHAAPHGGSHSRMIVDYLAATPGHHALADGTLLEVGYEDVEAYQISPDCGAELSERASWHELRFAEAFPGTPALLAQVQTVRNEDNEVPHEPARPFLTVAVDHLTRDGARVALERGQSKSGSISKAERVGYFAIAQRARSFLDSESHLVQFESYVTFPQIKGATRGNFYAGSRSFVGNAPMIFAHTASRNNPRGGWVRRQSSRRWHHYMQLDNTVECGSRDLPEADRVSVFLFSDSGQYALFRPLPADSISDDAAADSIGERHRASVTPEEAKRLGLPAVDTASSGVNMEVGKARFHHSGMEARWEKIYFEQTYPTVPLVFFLNDRKDAEPADVRIKKVTRSYVLAAIVEPPKFGGTHRHEEIVYLAIERGVHTMPDGRLVEAGTVRTNATQYDSNCATHKEKKRWSRVKFEGEFGAAPAVISRIQSLENERNDVPAKPSSPFLTSAVKSITAHGADLALERSRVKEGADADTFMRHETIAYVAFERGTGGFRAEGGQDVTYEFDITASMIRLVNMGCQHIGMRSLFKHWHLDRTPPLVLADKATHNSEGGGWMRFCGYHPIRQHRWTQHWSIRLVIEKDTSCSHDRSHTYERASLAVFSDPFVLRSASPPAEVRNWAEDQAGHKLSRSGKARMEAGWVHMANTFLRYDTIRIHFRKPFKQPPLVFTLPSEEGHSPASVKLFRVEKDYFEASIVTPVGTSAAADGQMVPYIAVEPGRHRLPDGTWFEAGTRSTARQVWFKECYNHTYTWDSMRFDHAFSSTPVVVTQIQSKNNEVARPPQTHSVPFLTPAVKGVTRRGMNLALERSRVAGMGSVRHAEEIGYLAMEPKKGAFKDDSGKTILFQAFNQAHAVSHCRRLSFHRQYSKTPIIVGALVSRHDEQGGWLRLCSSGATAHHIAVHVETDRTCMQWSRHHRRQTEDVSAFILSEPFSVYLN